MSAVKWKLQPDEYPTINLPQHSYTTVVRPRKSPKLRTIPKPSSETSDSKENVIECESKISLGTQVSDGSEDLIEQIKETVMTLTSNFKILYQEQFYR